MRRLITFLLNHKLLFIILGIGAYFRFVGIYPGYPSQHPDEGFYSAAISMVYNNNMDPLRYDYPSGVSLIHFLLFKFLFIPLNWAKFYLTNLTGIVDGFMKIPLSESDYKRFFYLDVVGQREINVLFWGRYITAAFGTGVVFLTYLLGKRSFGFWAGLASSFFVAVNFREVLNSHIGLPDIYNAFFLLLVLIGTIRLLDEPTFKNYLFVGLANGLYFSIKLHTLGILPFLLVQLWLTLKKTGPKIAEFTKNFFSRKFLIATLLFALIAMIISPYLLIKFEQTISVNTYTLSKYGIGSYRLYLYPFSYLYHIGVGQVLLFLSVIGVLLGVVKYRLKALLLLIVILQFIYIFMYYSTGGYYTRNLVTIIPLLLIFAGISIQEFFLLLSKFIKINQVTQVVVVALVMVISWSNITKSLIVVKEYSKPWNIEVLSSWLGDNIPAGARVSAHSNVPLPIKDVQRLTFDFHQSFSVDEFLEEGADYAVANFAWATSDAYWWMRSGPKNSLLHYWNKPLDILEYSYGALALRELQDSTIYSAFNPWQAPDTDFLVAKLPQYRVSQRKEMVLYTFDRDEEGWAKQGNKLNGDHNLSWSVGSLVIEQEPTQIPDIRWQSPAVDVKGWTGFILDFRIMSVLQNQNIKGGFVYVGFYKSAAEVNKSQDRVGVRLSARNTIPNKWINKTLVGVVPEGATYMTVAFSSYDSANSLSRLDKLAVSRAEVAVDYKGIEVAPLHIDQNNLFPNSHGNL